jgi:hypothetical protein
MEENGFLKDGADICMAPSQVKFAFRYSTQNGSNGRGGGRTVRTRVLDLEERRSTALRSSSP